MNNTGNAVLANRWTFVDSGNLTYELRNGAVYLVWPLEGLWDLQVSYVNPLTGAQWHSIRQVVGPCEIRVDDMGSPSTRWFRLVQVD